MIDSISQILEEIGKVVQNYTDRHPKDSEPYNVFKVLEISEREVLMCRILADLLNPQGSHNRGAVYLKSFLCKAMKRDNMIEESFADTHVYKEYPITADRRIDIVIQSNQCFIPIEVKINAGEQKSQCYDYFQFASQINKNAKVVYLTKWGYMPSEYSLTSADAREMLSEDNIMCLSFAEDIRIWLEDIIKNEEGVMKLIISQYLEAIKEFTYVPDKELSMDISKKLLEREDYFRSGLQVASAINSAKAGLIYKVMEEFEMQMEPLLIKYGLIKENRFLWYEYKQQATEDFYNCYSTYPGIDYVVKKAVIPGDYELWFRIEIENNLFAGFCVFDPNADSENGKGNQVNEIDISLKEEIQKYIAVNYIKSSDWWIVFKYLPTGSHNRYIEDDRIPNFKSMNEAAIMLSDESKRKEFVKAAIETLEINLLQLLK